MTEAEANLFVIKRMISELPEAEQKAVDKCKAKIEAVMKKYSPDAVAGAIAIVGLEMQREDWAETIWSEEEKDNSNE